MALSHLQTLGGLLTTQTRNVLSNTIRSLITLAVLLVTMAVLFHEGPRLLDTVRRSLPLGDKDKKEVFAQMQAVTRAVFFGVLMTALVQALLATLGFAIVGLAGAVTLGAATFFCALLPGGTALVWGPVVLWLFFSGHPVKALIVLAWGVAVVGTVDISRGVRMHLLLVFFGILGGIMAFGLIGLFTGPLVITLFLFFLEVVRRDFFTGEAAQTASS
jgi:predicted PurR-regulated permease PerM